MPESRVRYDTEDPRDTWFHAMQTAITALNRLCSFTPMTVIDPKTQPLMRVFICIVKMAHLLVTSDSWRRRTLTPLEAAQLERHLKEDLLPLITQATGAYIERRRAEEFTPTDTPTSEHPRG